MPAWAEIDLGGPYQISRVVLGNDHAGQFTDRFQGLAIGTDFALKGDGGAIDGISGATHSSEGVCEAIRNSVKIYPQVKKEALAS